MGKRKLELTRVPTDRGATKWRKIRKGKPYYFWGKYEDCVVRWHQKLVELEAEEKPAEGYHQGLVRKMNEWKRSHADEWKAMGGTVDDDDISDEKKCRLLWYGISDAGRQVWLERFREMAKPSHVPTTAATASQFLKLQKAEVELGTISAGRYDTLQRCVNHFAKFVGGATSISKINGATLQAYYTHLTEEKKANEWSIDYTSIFLIVAKQFTRWAYKTDLIENLPRNLSDLQFEIKPRKVPTLEIPEVQTLLANAIDRTKMFLLLMLNCGFTQKDISDLQPSEVDWVGGRITRKRSKHKEDDAPEIQYPLWKETFALLKQFGNQKGGRVLTNEKGGALKTEELGKGKLRKVDNIAVAYHRLCVKLKHQGLITKKKPLKLLRKTSPSLLATQPEFVNCSLLFLANSVRGVAYKHYIAPSQATFDRAVIWLGQQFGVNTI
ncbi:MAG: phage integrase SAM-like domain-containing protein [Planctomycetaceae bacterium]|nr:phage integrase SAM-like domain-containing protein [Planctomycetaceae bacterium]